jgi:hypothetical protein
MLDSANMLDGRVAHDKLRYTIERAWTVVVKASDHYYKYAL